MVKSFSVYRVNDSELSFLYKKEKISTKQWKDVLNTIIDYINYESPSGNKRNIFALDLFSTDGTSNPTVSIMIFQESLNKALKKTEVLLNIKVYDYYPDGTIFDSYVLGGVDGYFGGNTAKSLQLLLNVVSLNLDVDDVRLKMDGKIVSDNSTSLLLGKVLPDMNRLLPEFTKELVDFSKNHGHIQQYKSGISSLPLAINFQNM